MAEEEDMMLSLNETELYNIEVNYIDEPLAQEFTFTIPDGTFAGDFGANHYAMTARGDIESKQFYIGETDYLPSKKAKLDLKMDIDWSKELYTFEKSSLNIEGNVFEMNGTLQFFKGYLKRYFPIDRDQPLGELSLLDVVLNILFLLTLELVGIL